MVLCHQLDEPVEPIPKVGKDFPGIPVLRREVQHRCLGKQPGISTRFLFDEMPNLDQSVKRLPVEVQFRFGFGE